MRSSWVAPMVGAVGNIDAARSGLAAPVSSSQPATRPTNSRIIARFIVGSLLMGGGPDAENRLGPVVGERGLGNRHHQRQHIAAQGGDAEGRRRGSALGEV